LFIKQPFQQPGIGFQLHRDIVLGVPPSFYLLFVMYLATFPASSRCGYNVTPPGSRGCAS